MYITVSNEIKELSSIFAKNGESLYVVGGFVRDNIMERVSKEHNDTDLCSPAKPEKIVKMLKGTKFSTDDSNAKYGTVIITGSKRYEHTTFRRENYNLNGEHNPTGVEFIKDIRQDALRRDFTINAIYYNIETGDIVDPVGGVEHINKHILATPSSASHSFSEDAERILRMIRFACCLDYDIDEKTLTAAYENGIGLSNLSKTRIRAELDKMLECDTYYDKYPDAKYAHAKCMIMIGQLDLWKYILPAMEDIKESQILDEKGEEIYSHIINTLSVCAPGARLACLMHDVGKLYTKTANGSFNYSSDWADIIIEKNLGQEGLKYPKSKINQVKKIVSALDYDKHGFALKRNLRVFIRKNIDVFEDLCSLKDAIALENTKFSQKSRIAARWKKVYNQMKQNNTPFTLAELNVNGNDIIDVVPEINVTLIGQILNKLLDFCLHHPRCNTKEFLVDRAKKMILKNPSFYLE